MNKGRFDDNDWDKFSSAVKSQPQSQVFAQRKIKSTKDPRTSFDPKTLTVRESRDSDEFPCSTPIILAFDETGSMGDIPEYFVKEGLGVLMKEIFDRKPVSDPQIMCMAVGDAFTDSAPIQVTQFETDIKIAQQIKELYLEGEGGGNGGESYLLAWYFAATRTSTDAFEKRGEKGKLFTIGDEPPHLKLTVDQAKKFFGEDIPEDLSAAKILDMVSRQYDVYHLVIEHGGNYDSTVNKWNNLMGKDRVIRVTDYRKLSEVVTSILQVDSGADPDAVVKSWNGSTALVVAGALKNAVAKVGRPKGKGGGPIALPGPKAA